MFPNQVPEMPSVPERDTQKCCEKVLILNPNNFFLGTEKNLNGQKLDNFQRQKL